MLNCCTHALGYLDIMMSTSTDTVKYHARTFPLFGISGESKGAFRVPAISSGNANLSQMLPKMLCIWFKACVKCYHYVMLAHEITDSLNAPKKSHLQKKHNFPNWYTKIWHNDVHTVLCSQTFLAFPQYAFQLRATWLQRILYTILKIDRDNRIKFIIL